MSEEISAFILANRIPTLNQQVIKHLGAKLRKLRNPRRSFLNFVENTVVHERNLLEKWGTHRG